MDAALAGGEADRAGDRGGDLPRDGAPGAKKNSLKPWLKRCWCIPPKRNAEFVAAMEDVLEVYARPRDPDRPLVCLDEFCKQLLGETRTPLPVRPGTPPTYDYEYVRHGCASAFMIHAPLEATRDIFISGTATRTRLDYALAVEHITEVMFPHATTIILVEDNLNTHGDASLYEAFPAEKARRIAARIERHHTPKHGSWLNIAESEIAAILTTSIADRVATVEEFRSQCAKAAVRRNDAKATTRWQFTTTDARVKLHSLYPSPLS